MDRWKQHRTAIRMHGMMCQQSISPAQCSEALGSSIANIDVTSVSMSAAAITPAKPLTCGLKRSTQRSHASNIYKQPVKNAKPLATYKASVCPLSIHSMTFLLSTRIGIALKPASWLLCYLILQTMTKRGP